MSLAIPYSPLAVPLGRDGPSFPLLAALAAVTGLYVAATELTKRRFYRPSASLPV